MITSQTTTVNASNLGRHAAQDEAARLKAEILQRGNELANLERLAGSVQATRLESWPRADVLCSPASRSASTGKIIEQLQREIDHLRLSSQAATRGYESEKRAREALRVKCDDLELSIMTLRAERQAHSQTLQRSDKALHVAKDTTKELQCTLTQTSKEREELDRAAHEKDGIIADLRKELELEREMHDHSRSQYRLLSTEYANMRASCRHELDIIRQDLRAFMSAFQQEQIQVRTAKEDVILFNDQQTAFGTKMKMAQDKLASLRMEQLESLKVGSCELRCQMLDLQERIEEKHEGIEALQVQLEAVKESLRVIKI